MLFLSRISRRLNLRILGGVLLLVVVFQNCDSFVAIDSSKNDSIGAEVGEQNPELPKPPLSFVYQSASSASKIVSNDITSIIANENRIVVGTRHGLSASLNKGKTWRPFTMSDRPGILLPLTRLISS